MSFSYLKFIYQNPYTDAKKDKLYPLCVVEIRELGYPVRTKTGNWGRGIVAEIGCQSGKTAYGNAVWSGDPREEYNFVVGAKKALDRALRFGGVQFAPDVRKHIWDAFNDAIKLVEKGEWNSDR